MYLSVLVNNRTIFFKIMFIYILLFFFFGGGGVGVQLVLDFNCSFISKYFCQCVCQFW